MGHSENGIRLCVGSRAMKVVYPKDFEPTITS